MRHLFAAALSILLVSPVMAADLPTEIVEETTASWYVSLHGGVKFREKWQDDMDLGTYPDLNFDPMGPLDCDNDPCSVLLDLGIDTRAGYRVGGAVGFFFNEIFAVEGEVGYMSQKFDDVRLDSATLTETTGSDSTTFPCPSAVTGAVCSSGLDGRTSILTGMVNAIAGFPLGVIRPYVGVGAGLAHVKFNDVGLTAPAAAICCLDDSDTTFAAQIFGGADLQITDNVAIGGRLRYLHLGNVDMVDSGAFKHNLNPDGIVSGEVVLTFAF